MFDLTDEPLDPNAVMERVRHPGSGAIVVFLGIVRDEDQGRKVQYLEYDAYRPMAEKEMRKIGKEALTRWPAARVAMRHRFGRLEVGETALVIAVSAPHRADAFEACRYAIDRIKETFRSGKKRKTAKPAGRDAPSKTSPSRARLPRPCLQRALQRGPSKQRLHTGLSSLGTKGTIVWSPQDAHTTDVRVRGLRPARRLPPGTSRSAVDR
jgi:molybdopterin synthase catalytic subunit